MIGAFIIDKPEGLTSHDVVARMRRLLGIRRIGHTGTLDPFATGVLVICIGQATRLSRFLVDLPKEYLATVRLGFSTDTQDRTGKQISPLISSNGVSLDGIHQALREFIGEQFQTPPMFSAKQVAGERLYRAAREGREVERKPVKIAVYSIEATGVLVDSPGGCRDFDMRVKCSAGTYVRTLAQEIGDRLGVGGHLSALRRTAVGHFEVSNALTLDDLEEQLGRGRLVDSLIPPSRMLSHFPEVRLEAERVKRVGYGRSVELSVSESEHLGNEVPVRVCDGNGVLIAVATYDDGQRTLRPMAVLTS